ncbi:BMP family lipoprotein [Oceanotoga teriensis]|uniref:BMP family lipoprotein n=1 Tax=Oceanotoga teriensis TaxID=515440 RepID=UPI0027137FA1|nr:BMP family ABC transporter substrate-binding protein [Oceanotoga teriensis]MDO7975469.1 BMP family ABC transporter substrate-binding protein [Oceanotoga teriensis]
MKKILVLSLVLLLFVSAFSLKAIMVTDTGGLGDKSFNDGTWNGLLRAEDELKVDIEYIISKEQTDYITNLTTAAKNGDVMLGVGFLMADALFNVAPQFPDKKFIGIDISPSEGQTVPNNLALYTFKEQDGTFLAGYIAAAMNKTGKLGYVGGIRIPPVMRLELGFRAGIKAYNQLHGTNIELISGYAGAFDAPAKGKQMAMAQYEQGADIVFHAAGGTGNGVIDASKEKGSQFLNVKADASLTTIIDEYFKAGRGYFSIGVDSDQDYLAPGYVLASAMKRVDNAAFEGIKSARSARRFQSGETILSLADGGVSLSPMKYTKGFVPNKVFAELSYLEKLIAEGTLVIPGTDEAFGTFDVSSVQFPF